ncbi:MAG: hypothetical protein IJU52_08215 [Clostridia bacterium]|nr:hypothetical protein [Clostridia bacterium]
MEALTPPFSSIGSFIRSKGAPSRAARFHPSAASGKEKARANANHPGLRLPALLCIQTPYEILTNAFGVIFKSGKMTVHVASDGNVDINIVERDEQKRLLEVSRSSGSRSGIIRGAV